MTNQEIIERRSMDSLREIDHPGGPAEFMPGMSLEQASSRYQKFKAFIKSQMKEDLDFGAIPGTDKPTLLKPGAEKICTFFALHVEDPILVEKVEDWTGEKHGGEPFFYYLVCQRLSRNGATIVSQLASCNSWEKKYRYRWVREEELSPHLDKARLLRRGGTIIEPDFAIKKGETGGKYGKPAAYWQAFRDAIANGSARPTKKKKKDETWMEAWEIDSTVWRVPNEEIFSEINTIQRMAQKRALVGAALIAGNASEMFTADLEDAEPSPSSVEAHYEPAPVQPVRSSASSAGNGSRALSVRDEIEQEILKNNFASVAERLLRALQGCGVEEAAALSRCRCQQRGDLTLDNLIDLRTCHKAIKSGKQQAHEFFRLDIDAEVEEPAASEAGGEPEPKVSRGKKALKKTLTTLREWCEQCGLDGAEVAELCAHHGGAGLDQLTEEQAQSMIGDLEVMHGQAQREREPGEDDEPTTAE